jgi:DNA-binding transcriptional regulator YiaG
LRVAERIGGHRVAVLAFAIFLCPLLILLSDGSVSMTGAELKQLREDLGDAIGRSLSAADLAKLCGLAPGDGADTIRRWEVTGPSGPAAELLRILAMASDRYPILENFNVFDRFNIREEERPARREEFREKMRDEVRRRLV